MDATGTVTSSSKLRQYLLSYFIRDRKMHLFLYPYPGSAMKSSTYVTASGKSLTYTDSGSSLSIMVDGKVANVISDYNFSRLRLTTDVFQLIDTVL